MPSRRSSELIPNSFGEVGNGISISKVLALLGLLNTSRRPCEIFNEASSVNLTSLSPTRATNSFPTFGPKAVAISCILNFSGRGLENVNGPPAKAGGLNYG